MSSWKELEGKLVIELEFSDFKETFSFMTKVALLAEEKHHHPEWSNVYNKLRISLSTHDAGDVITEKDRDMARSISEML